MKINIRKLKISDANYFYEYATDKELRDNLPYPNRIEYKNDTLGFIRKYIKTANEFWNDKKEYQFGIENNKTKKVIGFICLLKLDWKNKKAEIGYWVSKKYRGKGLVKEASSQLLEFAFKELKLNKVYAEANSLNVASYKLLDKSGFKLERKIKKDHKINGKWTDQLFYGIYNNAKIKYQKAQQKDLKGIVRLSMLLNKDEPERDKRMLDKWAKRAIDNGMSWIAKDGDKIIGIIYCELKDEDHRFFPNSIFISELIVDDEYQRKGIGKELIKLALNKKYPKKYSYFSITHDPQKDWLTKYYSSFSFKKIGVTDVGNIKLIKIIRKPKIKIRPPKRSEYKDFAKVENSEAPQYHSIYTPEECDLIHVGKTTEKELVESARIRKFLVATIDNKIVGTMRYYLKDNGVLWVSMLQVLPEYQGKGVGTALFKEMEKIARKLKAKATATEAQKKATWAVNFYKANGYKILTQKDVDQKPFKGILEKPLSKHSYVFGKTSR